jgi:hypothetical protein
VYIDVENWAEVSHRVLVDGLQARRSRRRRTPSEVHQVPQYGITL